MTEHDDKPDDVDELFSYAYMMGFHAAMKAVHRGITVGALHTLEANAATVDVEAPACLAADDVEALEEGLAALMFIAANPPEAYPPTEEGLADGIKEAILAALDGDDGRQEG